MKDTIWKDGIEISRKSYDENGNEKEQRKNICYVERDKLNVENLTIFANFNPTKYLGWYVMDMSSKTVVFTSDSNSECEQWINQ